MQLREQSLVVDSVEESGRLCSFSLSLLRRDRSTANAQHCRARRCYAVRLLCKSRLASCLACCQMAMEASLRVDSVDTLSSVEVLHDNDLEAGSRTLARCNGGVGQEKLPNLN